jgi:excisionase family DNA binding protein
MTQTKPRLALRFKVGDTPFKDLQTGNQEALGPAEPLMTVAEAASFLRLRPKTLYLWVTRGKVPYLRAGSAVRFSRAELEAWLRGATKGGIHAGTPQPRSPRL